MPLESYTQGKILEYLRARGRGYWQKYHESQYTPAGVPDIGVGCYRGLYIAFEVKNVKYKDPYKQLSKEQKEHFKMILEAEGLVFAVNSVKEVAAILDGIDAELDG